LSARSPAEKLGIEPDTTVWSSPADRIELIDPMPDGGRLVDGLEQATTALVFVDSLWPILAEYGMRPVAQVSIDEVWSAMRFRPLKDGEEPFTGGSGR